MQETTRATWSSRVDAWKKSGQTAAEFAADKPYKGSTLVWRAWQLRRSESSVGKERSARRGSPTRATTKIALAEVVRRVPGQQSSAGLMVEVVGARISVSRGFDPALLRDVVHALRGAR